MFSIITQGEEKTLLRCQCVLRPEKIKEVYLKLKEEDDLTFMRESRSINTLSHVCFARFCFFLSIKPHPSVYRATLVSFRKLGHQEMGHRPVRHTINVYLFKIGIDHGKRLEFCRGLFVSCR